MQLGKIALWDCRRRKPYTVDHKITHTAAGRLVRMQTLEEIVANSRSAFEAWSHVPIRDRLRCVRRLRHLLVSQVPELSSAIHSDTRRELSELVGTDFLPTAAAAKYLETNAVSLLKPRTVSGRPLWLLGCRDVVHRRPRGVVGIIGTWNYPLVLNKVPILQAIVAGNAVVWKPSEQLPRTAPILSAMFQEAGFPENLIHTLPVSREYGPKLAEADIDFLHFTGSETVGRKLAARLGERLIPSTLELSGCDAMIVRADANVDLAARLAWYGATLNAGQTCMAVQRLYVAKERYAEFAELLRKRAADSPPLPVLLEGAKRQCEAIVEDAKAAGCEVVAGSASLIFNPNNLPNLRVNREPCFAPLLVVNTFETDTELPRRICESPSLLSVSIFTADTAFAQELAKQLPAGSVVINDVIVPTAHPATPFGGRGASGWGVSQGAEGLLEFTVPQVVTVRRGVFRPHADTTLGSNDVTHGLLRMTHSRTWRERFRGLRQLISGMRRSR